MCLEGIKSLMKLNIILLTFISLQNYLFYMSQTFEFLYKIIVVLYANGSSLSNILYTYKSCQYKLFIFFAMQFEFCKQINKE